MHAAFGLVFYNRGCEYQISWDLALCLKGLCGPVMDSSSVYVSVTGSRTGRWTNTIWCLSSVVGIISYLSAALSSFSNCFLSLWCPSSVIRIISDLSVALLSFSNCFRSLWCLSSVITNSQSYLICQLLFYLFQFFCCFFVIFLV